jgi:chromosome segregation ATPase
MTPLTREEVEGWFGRDPETGRDELPSEAMTRQRVLELLDRAETAERGASALRLELEEARRERIKALVELNATKAVLDTCERQVAELNGKITELEHERTEAMR